MRSGGAVRETRGNSEKLAEIGSTTTEREVGKGVPECNIIESNYFLHMCMLRT